MSRRSLPRLALPALLATLALNAGASASAGGAGAGLDGTWDVVHVAVDPADQPRWTWRPNDPRLLGRELVVGSTTLRWDADTARCDQPRWTRQTSTWTQLLRETYPRPPSPGRAAAPTAAEMGLAAAGDTQLALHRPRCSADAGGRVAAPWDDTWLVQTGPDRLLLRHGQALLQLARRGTPGVAHPSFSCRAAASTTEKALCGSVALAAWDRSVAQAWREARTRRPDDTARLQAEQRTWLQQRDACGADTACLHDRMQERVDALVQE